MNFTLQQEFPHSHIAGEEARLTGLIQLLRRPEESFNCESSASTSGLATGVRDGA